MWAWIRKHSLRRSCELLVTGGIIVGLVFIVVVLLMIEHKPGWYHPARLDEAGIQRANGEAVAVADHISDRMVEGRPFEVVLADRSVNEWLAAMPEKWPDLRNAWPPQLRDPAVRFERGTMQIGALYAGGAWRAIISVSLSLRVTADGTAVTMVLDSAHSGSLTLPQTVMDGLLDRLIEQARREQSPGDGTATRAALFLRKLNSAAVLREGVKIENRFEWFNGRRPYRVDSIRMEHGKLHLRIEPL